MILGDLLLLLEERLVQHDDNRKEVQSQLNATCIKALEDADLLEEKLNKSISKEFNKTDEGILGLIEKLKTAEEGDDLNSLIDQACEKLSVEQKYEIKYTGPTERFINSYEFSVASVKVGDVEASNSENIVELTKIRLNEHLDKIQSSKLAAQDRIAEICNERRNEAEKLKVKINETLEQYFSKEDSRIQSVVKLVKENIESKNPDEVRKLATQAQTCLLIDQRYTLNVPAEGDSLDGYNLVVTREGSLKCINFEGRRPSNFTPTFTDKGEISFTFTFFSVDELDILESMGLPLRVELRIWEKGCNEEDTGRTLVKECVPESNSSVCIRDTFRESTTYCLKMKIAHMDTSTKWSENAEFTTPEFDRCCVWKECPSDVEAGKKYSVDEKNPRIATKINGGDEDFCTIIGNTPIPLGTVTQWNARILRSERNNGYNTFIGVAPHDIDQNVNNFNVCGWYFYCYESVLVSGFPRNYRNKQYGPWKWQGEYVRTGDSVGVVMDTTKGDLSFVVSGLNFGVGYEGIPLDKPLVPCVILGVEADSVELDTSKVGESVDGTARVPHNIREKRATWDSITITWDTVEGASLYQIKVDEDKFWDISATNTFTKKRFLPDTEHSFKVRAIYEDTASKWSDAARLSTLGAPEFEGCAWKSSIYDVGQTRYEVRKDNPRVARKVGGGCLTVNITSTIIGSAPLPPSRVTSWNIKILSPQSNGRGIYVGVSPFDIDQDREDNRANCGWYFSCLNSTLYSGPPHRYEKKEYGSKKELYTGADNSVGVIMDTVEGELSFVIGGVNLGIAYEGIPLDKPLVPCVIIYVDYIDVELDLSEVKVNEADRTIPVPSKISTKSITWDSITLTWEASEGESLYQIEMDGSRFWDESEINTFMKRGLLAETEHSFRIRSINGNSVSEWSDTTKERTLKKSFETSGWKECPENVYSARKYIIDKNNPRIAEMNGGNWWYTIVGNTPVPPDAVTPWGIKILNSRNNNGHGIYVGVAPFDIDQNEDENHKKCGWYFGCYSSMLSSGPPHNYHEMSHDTSKEDGKCVHTGDVISVVMDTVNGELSFVVHGANLDVSFEGIPLDKPLVPCVILCKYKDSVELII